MKVQRQYYENILSNINQSKIEISSQSSYIEELPSLRTSAVCKVTWIYQLVSRRIGISYPSRDYKIHPEDQTMSCLSFCWYLVYFLTKILSFETIVQIPLIWSQWARSRQSQYFLSLSLMDLFLLLLLFLCLWSGFFFRVSTMLAVLPSFRALRFMCQVRKCKTSYCSCLSTLGIDNRLLLALLEIRRCKLFVSLLFQGSQFHFKGEYLTYYYQFSVLKGIQKCLFQQIKQSRISPYSQIREFPFFQSLPLATSILFRICYF